MVGEPEITAVTATPFAFDIRGLHLTDGAKTLLRIEQLQIPAGRVTALVGPNGAGKTSLLESLAGLRAARAESFLCLGTEYAGGNGSWSALRRSVTYVAQRPYLFRRSVFANVAYGLRVRREPDRARVFAALKRVGLTGYADRPAWKLSGGEAQRVAIARALAVDPPIFLFDEPTANLDRDFVPTFEALLGTLVQQGRTVVFSTHALDQAYRLGQQILSLDGGQMVPFPLANVVRGALRHAGDEWVLEAGPIRIVLPPPATAATRATVAIDPESILLSRQPLQSSARNCFPGVVTRVEGSALGFLVQVDCGVALVARVTARAFAELGLNIGARVFVTFKSTAVHWIDPPANSAAWESRSACP
ncbi:MAG: ATP-binding cassette domain-containing protein [Candidatus Binatia bacterium]|nr:ATP-binding cassette domain-containing protein [Candidatus Binatia bacterium]